MKKLIIMSILLIFVMSFAAFAGTATRSISGQTVTVNLVYLDSNSNEVVELLTGSAKVELSSIPAGCGLSNNDQKLKCSYGSKSTGTLVYFTTGAGAVSGTLSSFVPPATFNEDVISGDTQIPSTTPPVPPACTSVCTQGDRKCVGGNTIQGCSDFNGDGCFEWGGDIACTSGTSCTVAEPKCVAPAVSSTSELDTLKQEIETALDQQENLNAQKNSQGTWGATLLNKIAAAFSKFFN